MRDEIEGYVVGLLGLVGIEADPARRPASTSCCPTSSRRRGRRAAASTSPRSSARCSSRRSASSACSSSTRSSRRPTARRSPCGSTACWPRRRSRRGAPGAPLDIDAMLHGPTAGRLRHRHDRPPLRRGAPVRHRARCCRSSSRGCGARAARPTCGRCVYMDEVAGYLPPTANPPTKKPIMTLMKQARAFGVGVVLSTQNPVDVDYKAISNAGTWMIGRLQTERDKARLLDGHERGGRQRRRRRRRATRSAASASASSCCAAPARTSPRCSRPAGR